MKILVADDHPLIRRGLRQLLEDYGITASIDEAGDGFQAVRKVREWNPDVVLLDVHMPGKNGIEVLREIKQIRPRLPVLLMSLGAERTVALGAVREGASGYISKDSTENELIIAIRRVLGGGKYFGLDVAEMLVPEEPRGGERSPARLSPREKDVMDRIVEGKRIKQIAEELCCSPKTISTYRRRILDKMNMTSNAELIRSALSPGA